MTLTTGRIATMAGELRPPSDKSLTHRAYMLGAAAAGPSVVRNPLRGEDCEATLRCLEAMGLRATWTGRDEVRLDPAARWHSPAEPLDCGNSGTTMRLLSGLVASRPIEAELVGDASLSRRPMGRIAEPLRRMGATVEGDTAPLRIQGASLQGIDHVSLVASAQVKSCILLAGLRAKGTTRVLEPDPSRDHTERMLRAMGVEVRESTSGTGHRVEVDGGASLRPLEFDVPGDVSSAAFFMVAAALAPESRVTLRDVNVNPTRTGILDVFMAAGIRVIELDRHDRGGEPVASLEIHPEPIPMAFEITGALVPRLIDEIPVLAVLASQCDGISIIRDAEELRKKESDRIESVAAGLRAMGVRVEVERDGMMIWGPARLQGATVDAQGDHRLGMAFAVAGLFAEGQTTVVGADAIATSYPGFKDDLWSLCVV
ncbi:MAG: 3-phosphoshikimate 1-carboxyvinyltransferase [Fimbriimonadaceae bacterium]|nr:3-phosphoshikimate 1-carboxyvinyltransferase [Chthonomonadaceae bacterium]MCO5296908.1 3-phosphoshikimate 1-carboxyvinyltransferase [Fimbriimonadaceae bacterium]